MIRTTLRRKEPTRPTGTFAQKSCELASVRIRYGYRSPTVLLKREGYKVNAKRIYRLYTEEGLMVRTKADGTPAEHLSRVLHVNSR